MPKKNTIVDEVADLKETCNRLEDAVKKLKKETEELVSYLTIYPDKYPFLEKYESIKFKSSKQKYYNEHDIDIRFCMKMRRKLTPFMNEEGQVVASRVKAKYNEALKEYNACQEELRPISEELSKLNKVKFFAEKAMNVDDNAKEKTRSNERVL